MRERTFPPRAGWSRLSCCRVGDVSLDRAHAQDQCFGDFAVAAALGKQPENQADRSDHVGATFEQMLAVVEQQ